MTVNAAVIRVVVVVVVAVLMYACVSTCSHAITGLHVCARTSLRSLRLLVAGVANISHQPVPSRVSRCLQPTR